MEHLTPKIILTVIGWFFGTIGVLIGVVWYFLRSEIKDIKESINKVESKVSNIPNDFMSKKDCERFYNAKNNKKD